MKPDTLVFCILATIFSSSMRHVCGFLSAQAAARAATASSHQKHQQLQRTVRSSSSLYGGAGYLSSAGGDGGGGGAGLIGNGLSAGGSVALQASPHAALDSQERAVYDPGDELLRALNAELAANGHELGTSPEEPDYADTVYNELEVASKHDMLKKLEKDLREEQELVDKSALLMKMLEDPAIETLPLVYVEEAPLVEDYNEVDYVGAPIEPNGISKRSRYYRRYPWKRHTRNRGNYEPELRYACTPSKEDIFKLLVNLHENRKGNHSKTVNFCNRKRPAKAVFTNIRFLG